MIDRYDYEPISKIWSEKQKYSYWMQIEIEYFQNLTKVKIDPAILEISTGDILMIKSLEEETKHDIGAFVFWLEKKLQKHIGDASRYVHYGLTSSDVVDTAFSMAIRDTDEKIRRLAFDLAMRFESLSEKYSDFSICGRTHGQIAEEIKLRNKFIFYRNLTSLQLQEYYGRIAGSMGDYKHVDDDVCVSTISGLGLRAANFVLDGQIICRSTYACYMNNWAVLASNLAKIATDIRLLSQSEIGEMQEGFSKKQVGSSSMPHKKNPVLCENICGLARVIRGYQATAMQNIELWNERDISHSSAERIIFPQAANLLGFMLSRMTEIVDNLQINTDVMRRRVEENLSVLESQKIMLEAIQGGMTRKEAYNYVQNNNK